MSRLQTIYNVVAQAIATALSLATARREARQLFLGRLELIPVPVQKPQVIRRRNVSQSQFGRHNRYPNSRYRNSWNGN
jgi:hypothetical protein